MLQGLKYIFIITIFCQSCSNGTKTQENTTLTETFNSSDNMPKNDSITAEIVMKIVPDKFVSKEEKKAVYIITNHLPIDLVFGSQFHIERYEGGIWNVVPFVETLGFNDMLYTLKEGENLEIPVHISASIGREGTKKGRYRLVKEVEMDNKQKDKVILKAEFLIQ